MKEITGRARGRVPASMKRCFALLEALDEYPDWIGEYIREVQVLQRDRQGRPKRALAMVHVEQSWLGKDFELVVEIEADPPHTLRLSRVPEDGDDLDQLELVCRLEEGSDARLELEFAAQVSSLPSLLPIGDAGDAIAETVVAAVARTLDGGRPKARRATERRT